MQREAVPECNPCLPAGDDPFLTGSCPLWCTMYVPCHLSRAPVSLRVADGRTQSPRPAVCFLRPLPSATSRLPRPSSLHISHVCTHARVLAYKHTVRCAVCCVLCQSCAFQPVPSFVSLLLSVALAVSSCLALPVQLPNGRLPSLLLAHRRMAMGTSSPRGCGRVCGRGACIRCCSPASQGP
jgi:hypothetical protein